jgi:ATPase subunit of ABC transporter with duplicated ATPase domains
MEAKNNELLILDEPTNYMKEVSNINSKKWLEAMKF